MFNSKCCCGSKGMCTTAWIGKILLIIGGLDLGLIGIGMLVGSSSWNVLHMVLGFSSVLEAVIYILIGLAAIMKVFGCCKCHKCVGGDTGNAAGTEARM